MEVSEEKFFWIYEAFTSMETLNRTDFPTHEEFYRKLKQKNITVEEYNYCKSIWLSEVMTTLRDLLIYYNEKDCVGLVEAIEKQMELFRCKGLDIKSAISVPGLSLQYLFKTKDPKALISMFGYKHKDLYHLVRSNIRGGLSMVFHRYHAEDKTYIKQQYFGSKAEVCQSIQGLDISAMYLSNLMRDQPTGAFVRRRRENDFKAEHSQQYGIKATQWIEWIGYRRGLVFQHMFNSTEKRLGMRQLPVDGFTINVDGKQIVLQFLGCYFHSHECTYYPRGKGKSALENLQIQLETYKNLKYLKSLGYEVEYIWECQFDMLLATNSDMREYIDRLDFLVDKRAKLNEKTILEEVKTGKLFGMIEVDIETPVELLKHFAEFQPIIKHCNVSKEDIGEHMKKFANDNDLLKKPSHTLLCSYYADKILLATPLLQWYLQHGLVVTKVHQVIPNQTKPMKCFETFGQEVMAARRLGDIDPSKQIISASSKLMGMSNFQTLLL